MASFSWLDFTVQITPQMAQGNSTRNISEASSRPIARPRLYAISVDGPCCPSASLRTSARLLPLARLNRREKRPAVIYVHPWEIDPAQPRVHNAPWKYRFRHYVNLRTTIPKLTTLFRHFKFTTVQDVVDRAGELELVSLD